MVQSADESQRVDFDPQHKNYRHFNGRFHIETITRIFVIFELIVVTVCAIAALIELFCGAWMNGSHFVGVMLGLTTWFGCLLASWFAFKTGRPILLTFLAVFKLLIVYTCFISLMSLTVIVADDTKYMSNAVTFHGKLNASRAPALLALSTLIAVFDGLTLAALYKCYRFMSDRRNHRSGVKRARRRRSDDVVGTNDREPIATATEVRRMGNGFVVCRTIDDN